MKQTLKAEKTNSEQVPTANWLPDYGEIVLIIFSNK